MCVPSLATRMVSKWSTVSPRRRRRKTSSSSAIRSDGTMSVIGFPTASAGVYPNILTAAGFQEVMMPSSVLLTIASSEELTIAARRCDAISAWRRS